MNPRSSVSSSYEVIQLKDQLKRNLETPANSNQSQSRSKSPNTILIQLNEDQPIQPHTVLAEESSNESNLSLYINMAPGPITRDLSLDVEPSERLQLHPQSSNV